MEKGKRFEGKNLDAAITKACEYFNREKEELEIEIIDQGSSGIFGIGGRKAIIEAKPRYHPERLEQLIKEMVGYILSFMSSSSNVDVEIRQQNVNVSIDNSSNSGLIIGREGQTISALEHLINKMISKKWPEKIYIHLDAAGYRERQEGMLKKHAIELARRAKSVGKPFSTRPLSSYHRRVVHMALKNDKDIITQSKGDGPFKRVQIAPRRRVRRKTR